VVADEVRKLAERTGKSTQEIGAMIDKIQQGTRRAVQEMEAGVERVNEGVNLAHQAGDSVTGIRDSAERVTHAVDDISLALREQTVAARDIAQKVERIAQGAERTARRWPGRRLPPIVWNNWRGELDELASRFRDGTALSVIPAQGVIQKPLVLKILPHWTPASAGVTARFSTTSQRVAPG
jgi:methyl-accepting chemotaxis protein